jgi:hypothetical protein
MWLKFIKNLLEKEHKQMNSVSLLLNLDLEIMSLIYKIIIGGKWWLELPYLYSMAPAQTKMVMQPVQKLQECAYNYLPILHVEKGKP